MSPATGRPARRWRLVRARRDAVPASVRRFNQRARRRRLRAAAPWAAAAGLLLAAGLTSWLVYGTSVLGARQVRVDGTAILSPEQVREAAAVVPDTPLARVDVDAVEERVAALPPVAQVTVARQWPDTVRISVVERTAVAVLARDGAFALIDGSGVVFHSVAARPDDLPLLTVDPADPADPTTRSALQVLAALTPELREQLVELVAEAPARIRLLLVDGRVIVWGDATDSATKAKVATALLGQPGREIDVSAPDVVTVR
ncbi:MAG: FtsQ-type POTRA domain-containing protein [Micromonosporaceae bacterium]